MMMCIIIISISSSSSSSIIVRSISRLSFAFLHKETPRHFPRKTNLSFPLPGGSNSSWLPPRRVRRGYPGCHYAAPSTAGPRIAAPPTSPVAQATAHAKERPASPPPAPLPCSAASPLSYPFFCNFTELALRLFGRQINQIQGHALHEKGLQFTKTNRRRYTGQRPGTKRARGPADKPRINHG